MNNLFKTNFNMENFITFVDKSIPMFSNEPIINKGSEGIKEYEFYDIKSPSNLNYSVMSIRIYFNTRKIYFIGRDKSELLQLFNHFTINHIAESDLFSVINLINKVGEKYGIYDKDKNKKHEKKIKRLLKNRKEVAPQEFFKTVYDIVGISGNTAWSKHGPTYLTRQYYIMDDNSLSEWYIVNYPISNNFKVIVHVARINEKLNIAVSFKEGDELQYVKNLKELEKKLNEKFLSIYLYLMKKHLKNEIKEFNQDDITLLRMLKI